MGAGARNQPLAEAAQNRRGAATKALVTRLTTSRRLETRLALQTANAQVVARPDAATQVQPRPLRTGLLGLLVGVVLGLAAVFLRDEFDARVRTSGEAETLLATPILSRIPRPQESRGTPPILAMRAQAGGQQAEAFRILRSNLNFGLLSSGAKVVMVTSAIQAEGKSTTLANLAVAYALSGKRVAIVDLDLRRPSLAKLFSVANGRGVAGVALGESSLTEALEPVDLGGALATTPRSRCVGLDLLTTGALPPDPSEFINSEAVRGIVRQLRQTYDLVLLDAPPLLAVSDTTVISELADAVFACVRLGVAQRTALAPPAWASTD